MWEKVQKNEKIDETKLKEAKLRSVKLTYTLCQETGCTAEMEATPNWSTRLKTAGGLLIVTLHPSGRPIGFPVPLNGFASPTPANRSTQAVQGRGAR